MDEVPGWVEDEPQVWVVGFRRTATNATHRFFDRNWGAVLYSWGDTVEYTQQRQTWKHGLNLGLQLDPEAPVVLTVKNPFALWVSEREYREDNGRPVSPPDLFCERFCYGYAYWLEVFPKAPLVRHEDLVRDPETTILEAASGVGLSEPAGGFETVDKHVQPSGVHRGELPDFDRTRYTNAEYLDDIDPDDAHHFSTTLRKDSFQPLLRMLGYPEPFVEDHLDALL